MAPRKKIHTDATARVQASRARREQEGMRQVNLWLSERAIARLDALVVEREKSSRGELIEELLVARKGKRAND